MIFKAVGEPCRLTVVVAILFLSSCGSSTPTGPGTNPPPPSTNGGAAGGAAGSPQVGVGNTSTSQPNLTAALSAAVSVNPVPFGGNAITDAPACTGIVNTWFYSQTLTEINSVNVT